MCGIIGYVGERPASAIIAEGLKRLEYRGYDSAGIAILNEEIELRKGVGMVEDISSALKFTELQGKTGIGHTRWATHGGITKENAHPHIDSTGTIALVHNGIIENFAELRAELEEKGHKLESDTDSEIIVRLVEEYRKTQPLPDAFRSALKRLEGSYAIALLHKGEKRLLLARKGSPLVIGIGKNEMFCASDIPAMLQHTRTFVPLHDGDIAELTKDGYKIYNGGKEVQREKITVDWNLDVAEKAGYQHFMLKEIHEQEHTISQSLSCDVSKANELIDQYSDIHIIACGTSYHAGLLLSYLLTEKGKNAQAFIASDYPFISKPGENTLVIAISQSGETADVLQALRYASSSKKIAITNMVGSTVQDLADVTLFLYSGTEEAVAATKTFTSQLAVIFKLAYGKAEGLQKLIKAMLEKEDQMKEIAEKLKDKEDVFFIARGNNVPIAYEGSLKFKEITYIHSEAYPGGELKHGTLSLITDGVPVIALAPKDATLKKMVGNIIEAKSRGGFIISLTDDGYVKGHSDLAIELPEQDPKLYPFSLIIPLQMLAYHVSVLRGINPDRPRNLAKSVTVE